MAHLFAVVDMPDQSRLTHVWDSRRTSRDREGGVVTVHQVDLPVDQDVDIESDFLSSHLPFSLGGVGGRYPDGSPWLIVVQHGARIADLDDRQDVGTLAQAMTAALEFNPGATARFVAEWRREDLLWLYGQGGVKEHAVDVWTTADLAVGLLAECCGGDLTDLAAGFIAGCAFPDQEHACEGDVFTDVFASWQKRLTGQADPPL